MLYSVIFLTNGARVDGLQVVGTQEVHVTIKKLCPLSKKAVYFSRVLSPLGKRY